MPNSDSGKENASTPQPEIKKVPKVEDKPFESFVNEDLIPGIKDSLLKNGVTPLQIKFQKGERPVIGGSCWIVYGEMPNERQFWLCFDSDKITSFKTISLADAFSEPSLVESFLIDEKKITLPLLISRLLQRLNGQKWLSAN